MPASEIVPIDSLRANPFNTNQVDPSNQAKLDASLRRHGVFKPIVVREIEIDEEIVLEIVGGEHRWDSAVRIGLKDVPIFNLGPISDEKAKEIMLADNARYGADDALLLAELLQDMSSVQDLETFLPMTESDLTAIFSATNISLANLEIDDNTLEDAEKVEEKREKSVKTHSVMKFKVPVKDAEKIAELIAKTQSRHGYSTSDELTNAGDALVHLLFEKMA